LKNKRKQGEARIKISCLRQAGKIQLLNPNIKAQISIENQKLNVKIFGFCPDFVEDPRWLRHREILDLS